MARVIINLIPAQNYVKSLCRHCEAICKMQGTIDAAYNRLGETWRDNIYIRTGEEMKSLSGSLSRVYGEMDAAIKRLQEMCIELCAYNEIPPQPRVFAPEYRIKIQENIKVKNDKIATDPEALEHFEHSLAHYIESIRGTVASVRTEHASMHQDWRDEQYERFTETLNQFSTKIDKQLEVLRILNILIKKKRLEMLAAMKKLKF